MEGSSKALAALAIVAVLVVMLLFANQSGNPFTGSSRPPEATAPIRSQVMRALNGAGRLDATEAQKRLQVLLDARQRGEFVDLLKLRQAVVEAVREANAIDDIADTATGLDELPPEYAKIVYPNGRPKAAASVPASASTPPPGIPEAVVSPPAPSPPAPSPAELERAARRREYFDSFDRIRVSDSDVWKKVMPPTNESFLLEVSGTLTANQETADARRETGPKGFPLTVLQVPHPRRISNPDYKDHWAESSHLIFQDANWGALLGRFCSGDACQKPMVFPGNPWKICIPKDYWFEVRINVFHDRARSIQNSSRINDWSFDNQSSFQLRPVMLEKQNACTE